MQFSSPTLASLSKLRPAPPPPVQVEVTSQVTDLRRAVKRLRRDASQTYELEYETQKTFEHLAGQVETIRSALASVASVVEDEFTAVRSELDQSSSEIGSHLARNAAALKSIQVAAASNKDTQGATNGQIFDKIAALAAETGRVDSAVAAVAARVSNIEDSARLESHTIRGLIRDNQTSIELVALQTKEDAERAASLRSEITAVAAAQSQLQSTVANSAAAVARLESNISSLTSQVASLQTTLASVAQSASDAQATANANTTAMTLGTSSAGGVDAYHTVYAHTDASSPVMANVQSELAQLRDMVQSYRDEAATASSALAQDVHTLADEASSMKLGFNSAMETMYERLRSYVMTVEKSAATQTAKTASGLAALDDKVSALSSKSARDLDRALDALRETQSEFKATIRTDLDALTSESRKLRSSVRLVESAVQETGAKATATAEALASVAGQVDHVEAEARALKSHSQLLESQMLSHRSDVQHAIDSQKRETMDRVARASLRASDRDRARARERELEDQFMLSLRSPLSTKASTARHSIVDEHAFLDDL
ncbi:uncharacterized protein AMSG_00925 [Thecamonas trahens ATCC 50062]|uniref:Uncharacterized protein n=1 Tax=Thecamonas trahens ATCC 50062 TaxID=461836 RepID=A0A0L0DII8_THETB|nr:hypothetical protein AMSG_00925 [Thecamonas trahens ATCC 50062]KNC52097.1 hypothetical protein AMSG_00925 [Thecamonas trahens ATCC 50062]|eukprot:XP_013762102.1 hypothetical protein AMSG_00925 [Thecamonas trahens ATCC 50062]